MNFYTPKQIAEKWGVTAQLVRRYCKEGKIKSAIQYEGGWLIPEGTAKPNAPDAEEEELPKLVKKILYQRERNNHFGIYEYIQVNLAYSSNRMASNRLTRQQVEEMYRTKRLTASFEPTKVDDIVEMMNHFTIFCIAFIFASPHKFYFSDLNIRTSPHLPEPKMLMSQFFDCQTVHLSVSLA